MRGNSVNILKRALNKWGLRAQLEMLQEEATELALATRSVIRGKVDSVEELAGEIADVEIMIEQMKIAFEDQSLRKQVGYIKRAKLRRLKGRLERGVFNG